jgi:hypothetical protein
MTMTTSRDQEKMTSSPDPEISIAPETEAIEALKAVKAGHANDVDIAAQILANNIHAAGIETWTAEEDRKLIRRVDWRLIPIVIYISFPSVIGAPY